MALIGANSIRFPLYSYDKFRVETSLLFLREADYPRIF